MGNRIRFVVETLDAMIEAAGSAAQVAIKISPGMPFNDCTDADPKETYTMLVKAITNKGLAYLHVLRTTIPSTFELLRPHYTGTFAAGGAFTRESGEAALKSGARRFHRLWPTVHRQPRPSYTLCQECGAKRSRSKYVLLAGSEGLYGPRRALTRLRGFAPRFEAGGAGLWRRIRYLQRVQRRKRL